MVHVLKAKEHRYIIVTSHAENTYMHHQCTAPSAAAAKITFYEVQGMHGMFLASVIPH